MCRQKKSKSKVDSQKPRIHKGVLKIACSVKYKMFDSSSYEVNLHTAVAWRIFVHWIHLCKIGKGIYSEEE